MDDMEDGFYDDLSNEEYHGNSSHVSSSGLKLMLKDPAGFHERYVLGEASFQGGDFFDFGSYVHSLILEPHKTDAEFAIYDGKVRRGAEFEAFKTANEGKVILTKSQALKAREMALLATEAPFAKDLLETEGHICEQSLFVELDGIKVKVRSDHYASFVDGGRILDVKTTISELYTSDLQDVCDKYSYDLSAALYVDAYSQQLGMEHDFYFLFISKQYPFKAEVLKASKQMLENGRRKYKAAIKLLKEARETGVYVKEENGPKEISMKKKHLFYEEE